MSYKSGRYSDSAVKLYFLPVFRYSIYILQALEELIGIDGQNKNFIIENNRLCEEKKSS